MTLKDIQKEVDDWINQFKIGYWKPHEVLARLTEETGELAKAILNIDVKDYTNGFRIYSKKATYLITKKCGKIGDGFIVLSEILLILNINKFKIHEVSTVFVNRKRGESSVNLRLVLQSFIGLIKLFLIKKNYKN